MVRLLRILSIFLELVMSLDLKKKENGINIVREKKAISGDLRKWSKGLVQRSKSAL